MLDEKAIKRKLYDLAAVFKVHMKAKRYNQARYCYDRARTVVTFNEMGENISNELFGVHGEKGAIILEGMFQEMMVQKAYSETCVKAQENPDNCLLCQKLFGGGQT